MKIALAISGQPRNHRKGFLEIKKHFLNKYDIDVYLHSWKGSNFNRYRYGGVRKSYEINSDTYDDLLNWYQPKDYLFEKPIDFDSTGIEDNQRINSQMGCFMSAYRAWNLIEQSGIKYDLVIKTRYDLFFTHYLDANDPVITDVTKLDPNKVMFLRRDGSRDPENKISVNDGFAIGGYNVMKVYYNLFPNMIQYQFVDPNYDSLYKPLESKFYNETIVHYHLKNNNIPFYTQTNLEPRWSDGARILD